MSGEKLRDASSGAGGAPVSSSEVWDARAAQYERRREPKSLLIARILHEHLGLPSASAVLEVGAGAGAGALAMSARMGRGTRLVVTDLSPVMLQLARRKLQPVVQTNDGSPVEFHQADAQHIPFPDASFDSYAANMTLMLVDQPELALREAARVLRPGGRLAMSVWGRREQSSSRTLFWEALDAAGIVLPAARPNLSRFRLGDREQLSGMLSRAGLRDVITWYHTCVEPVEDGDSFAAEIMAIEPAAGELDPSQLSAVHRRLADLAQERLSSGRPISLDILIAIARKPLGESI